ncbi:MAG TPA: hypothetical protein VL688_05625 [Verrucomicrobiae bacterium]|jgi:hypothetical protein|nr:hypothetical protein [Verrucomicrobiae bacterium]
MSLDAAKKYFSAGLLAAVFCAVFFYSSPCRAAGEKIQLVAKIKIMEPVGAPDAPASSKPQPPDAMLFFQVKEGEEIKLPLSKTAEPEWYEGYLKKEGYLASSVPLSGVESVLLLHPKVEGAVIQIEVVPGISYQTEEGKGVVAVSRLAATYQVPPGEPVEVGGRKSEFETKFFRNENSETLRVILLPELTDS